MTTADFRKQQEESNARFSKQVQAFYSGSLIILSLTPLLYLMDLIK